MDFLYNLGARNSLIRVRSMTLSRDPSQIKLQGNITLVESFQRKPPPKALTAAPSPAKTTNQTVNAVVPPAKATNPPPKLVSGPPRITNAPPKADLNKKLSPPNPKS